MKDRYGRKINYLRVSVTNKCNLRCQYCMPKGQDFEKIDESLLSLEEMYTIIQEFVALGINKIRITGGEPLLRPGIIPFIQRISQLRGIEDLAMTTNGILLKRYVKELKAAGIRRLNISLDSLDKSQYEKITGGGDLQIVLEGIQEAKKVGLLPIKINTVLIKDFNDSMIREFVNWTKEEEIEIRFIELMPIGSGISWSEHRFLSADTVLKEVPELQPMEINKGSSTATYYCLPEGKGKVGLIRPVSCKFCDQCNRIRLTAKGQLKSCLLSNEIVDLKEKMREQKDIKPILEKAILQKPQIHRLEQNEYIETDMFQIGG